jgi:hypothetical protein
MPIVDRVGLFDILTRPGKLGQVPVVPGLESPNQTSTLAKLVYAEYFVGEIGEVTRESALQIPSIKKARDVLLGAIAGMQLREYEGDTEVDQPWLYSTKSPISPWHRTAYVFDDLFFYDWSALAVERDSAGQIIDAIHIPFARWSADAAGVISIDNKPVDNSDVVLIPGNGSGGVLVAGAATIKGAAALQRAWVGRAQNPIPLLILQQVSDDEIDDDEIDEMIEAYSAARTSPNGAVAFADNRIKPEAIGTVDASLFENGRNAAVLDAARVTGVPASILDGSQSTASLTYSTTEGKRNEFDDYSLPMYTDPLQARLSLDDVSAKGRVIRFDHSQRNAIAAAAVTAPTKD